MKLNKKELLVLRLSIESNKILLNKDNIPQNGEAYSNNDVYKLVRLGCVVITDSYNLPKGAVTASRFHVYNSNLTVKGRWLLFKTCQEEL